MPDTLLHNKPSLAYAKLVATPSESSWSQVYNAGSLFACLSLTVKANEEPEESLSLQAIGKEIFNILESEFFSLSEKNMHTIKKAIEESLTHAPPSVSVNLSLALFKNDVLYVFIAGAGKIIMKRDHTTAVLLEHKQSEDIIAASGYLKNKDTIILETEQFAKDISPETIASALDLALPNDIAEVLSPHMHEKDDGGQAAIIIVYHGISFNDEDQEALEEKDLASLYEEQDASLAAKDHEPAPEEERPEEQPHKTSLSPSRLLSKLPRPHMPSLQVQWLTHKRRLFLSIAVVLVLLLVTSIYLTTTKKDSDKRRELFQTIYTPAEKFYDEGKGLQSLNKNLSRDNFLKAEKILKDGQQTIKKGTPEYDKLQDLLTKVESELQGSTSSKGLPAKEIDAKGSLLSIKKSNTDAKAAGETDSNVFLITDKAVLRVDKASGTSKEVIKNDGDWQSPQSIIPYQGNIYILDQKKAVLKYVPSGDGYSKSTYFKQNPDLSHASGMAIDGSVWIANNGTILKYTKGESDGFKIKGLDKPLSSQLKLFTGLDISNLYVLDIGNARIVKFSKDGSYQTEYVSNIIAEAKDFMVQESDKKILLLARGKVWEIEMK